MSNDRLCRALYKRPQFNNCGSWAVIDRPYSFDTILARGGNMKAIRLFIVLAFACAVAWAQATSQIQGIVQDSSGAVVPGVEVKATQTETGVVRTAVSAEDGRYVLPNLPIGPYRLEVNAPGFSPYAQTGIVLQVASIPTVNIVLQVGGVNQQVEVESNAALV